LIFDYPYFFFSRCFKPRNSLSVSYSLKSSALYQLTEVVLGDCYLVAIIIRPKTSRNIVEMTFDFDRGASLVTRNVSLVRARRRIEQKSQHLLDARIYIIHRGSRAHWTDSDTQLTFSSPSMLSSCVVESSPDPPVCTEPRFSLVELRLIGGPPRL